jgi:beta-barrel assembly-enhancing protease
LQLLRNIDQVMQRYKVLGVAILVAFLFSDGPFAQARYEPQPCKNAFTPEREIQEGQKAKAEVLKSLPMLPDSSPITQYAQRLGAKLVQYAPGKKWPYEFHVVNQVEINAFALPGGPIFVNLGTIQAAETEAQLAGVMAHEISHVALRHSTCNITKQQTPSLLAGLGQMAAGILLPGSLGTIAQTGIGAAAGFGFLKMSRESEKQADLVGTDILYDAGYDPRAMPQFFEVIQGRYGNGGAQFLSDHPNPGNRIDYVQVEIESLPPKAQLVKTTDEFTKINKMAKAMHAYTAQEIQSGEWRRKAPTGTGPANASPPPSTQNAAIAFQPNGQWKTLETSQYSMIYPANWQVASSADSPTATIAPPGGVVEGSNQNSSVAYGVVADVYPVPKAGMSFTDAFRKLLDTIIAQNPGLQASREPEDILVNQRPAKDVELLGPSALHVDGKPIEEKDWLVAVQRSDGSISCVVFISPSKDFKELQPTFVRMLQSFKEK